MLIYIVESESVFLELSCISCLYIFEISCLSVSSIAIIFSHSEGCLFTLLIVSFVVQKLLSSIRFHGINKIRNENGEITTDNTEIQRIIRDYYQQLYAKKMDNVEEMDKFLEKYNIPKLNQEEIEILNNPITSIKTEAVIKNLPENKSPGRESFTGEFYQTFGEEPVLIFLKLLQKIAEEGTFPNTFFEVSIIPIPKPDKDNTKKENYRPISHIEC